jgi:hypothetical protein
LNTHTNESGDAMAVEQVVSTRSSVGGVKPPDPLRPGVVRACLADVLI